MTRGADGGDSSAPRLPIRSDDRAARESSAIKPDAAQIMRAVSLLHGPDGIVELRAFPKGRKRVDAGYFDGKHREVFAAEAVRLNAQGAAVYFTLNELDPQLLARYANRVQEHAPATSTDANVIRRHWLLIDIDPQRPKDTSATDTQLAQVMDVAQAVYKYLTTRGWPKPASADSGNGLHFLYRVELPNDDLSRDLVKNVLEALAMRFDTDTTKIDKSVFNAARISKTYGTLATKGDNLPAAPWRLSKLRTVPTDILPVPIELLRSLAAEVAPEAQPPKAHIAGVSAWSQSDVQAFLTRGHIESVGPDRHEGALRWKLKTCPFNPDHGFGESAVFLLPDGKLGFDCRHNSCSDKHWRELRDLVDPERKRNAADATAVQRRVNASTVPRSISSAADLDEPLAGLVCAASIKPEPINWLWNGWLAAGKLHILAGAPGAGKTTLALALAATITSGGQWPDGTRAAIGDVLMWTSEDDAQDTLVPRLIAMGTNLSRVHFIQTASEGDKRRAFDPATDIAQLRSSIKLMGMHPRMLIVDPIVSAVAGDSHKGSETRRSLQPLVDLGAEIGCAVLGISHFSKGTQGRDTIERVTGSLAFGALARLVFAAAKMADDQGGGRFIARAKSNIGPDGGGYKYELHQSALPDHPSVEASSVLWGESIEGSAREILAKAEAVEDSEARTQTSEAEDWLCDLLSNGPVKAGDAIKKSKMAGVSDKALRTARERLRVRPKKSAYSGGWTWALPDCQDAQPAEDAQGARSQSVGTLGAFDDPQGHLGTGNGKKAPNGEDF